MYLFKDKHLNPQFLILICILSAIFMSKLDDYIVSIALPHIATQFKISTSDVSLVTLSYMLALTSTIIIWGAVGDRIGFKKTIIAGYILFTISSFLCGFSENVVTLVIFRFLQGLGGSILLVSSQAMIPTYFEGPLKAKVFGLLTVAASVGMTLGPSLGGIITEYLGWQWVFFVNIPVGIVVITLSLKYIQDVPKKQEKSQTLSKSFDFRGAFLTFMMMFSLVFALNRGQEMGWTSPIIVFSFCLFILFIILLITFERNNPTPLVDLKLLSNKNFAFSVTATLFAFLLIGGNLFLMPFYLTIVLSLSAIQSGLAMAAYPFFFLIASSFTVTIINRFSHKFLCSVAMLITLSSWVIFSLTLNQDQLFYVILFLATTGIGLGIFFAPNTSFAMNSVSVEKAGIASGLYRTMGNFGIILGISIFEMIYSNVLHQSHTITNINSHLKQAHLGEHLVAFQYAYTFGAIICLIPLILSLVVKEQKAIQQ